MFMDSRNYTTPARGMSTPRRRPPSPPCERLAKTQKTACTARGENAKPARIAQGEGTTACPHGAGQRRKNLPAWRRAKTQKPARMAQGEGAKTCPHGAERRHNSLPAWRAKGRAPPSTAPSVSARTADANNTLCIQNFFERSRLQYPGARQNRIQSAPLPTPRLTDGAKAARALKRRAILHRAPKKYRRTFWEEEEPPRRARRDAYRVPPATSGERRRAQKEKTGRRTK